MKLIAVIVQAVWGVALPIEQLDLLVGLCGQTCLETLLRFSR